MIRKNLFDLYSIRYNPQFTIAEDYELFSRAIRYGDIDVYNEVLLNYRDHCDNSTNTRKEEMMEKTKKVRNNLLSFLTENEEGQRFIENRIVNNVVEESVEKNGHVFSRYCIKMFDIIPILKIIKKNNKIYYKLFGFIPLLKINKK